MAAIMMAQAKGLKIPCWRLLMIAASGHHGVPDFGAYEFE
jgi:hypothetical protein